MECEKLLCAVSPHIALEQLSLGGHEVNHHECVHDVGKIAVYVETRDSTADVQVLSNQHRDPASSLNVGNHLRQVLEATERIDNGLQIQSAWCAHRERPARTHRRQQRAVVRRAAEVAHHQFPRYLSILLADAHRAKYVTVARVADHESADPLPEEEKRGVRALIIRMDG